MDSILKRLDNFEEKVVMELESMKAMTRTRSPQDRGAQSSPQGTPIGVAGEG